MNQCFLWFNPGYATGITLRKKRIQVNQPELWTLTVSQVLYKYLVQFNPHLILVQKKEKHKRHKIFKCWDRLASR